MTGWFSAILDALRFLFALGVALSHLDKVSSAFSPLAALPSHFFVMCFFVLSGYLIAYSCDQKHRSALDYAIARISRVFPVLLGSIILTELLVHFGKSLHPIYQYKWTTPDELLRVLLSTLNLQEVWFYSLNPNSNTPLWSLAYECWYYLLFGLAFYLRGPARIGLLVLGCLAIGPHVLLLMPVWLMGVACYYGHRRITMGRAFSRFCLIGCLLILAFLVYLTPFIFGELIMLRPVLFW